MAHRQRWIEHEEAEDHQQEAEAVKAAEELKKKERAEVAAA